MAKASLVINIWTDGRKRLPSDLSDLAHALTSHMEHVAGLVQDGCQSGEIVDDKFSGWWSIHPGKNFP